MNSSFKKTKKNQTETPGGVRMLSREEITDGHISYILKKLNLASEKTDLINILGDKGLNAQLFADKAMKTIFHKKRVDIVKLLIDCKVQFSSSILSICGSDLISKPRRQILKLLLKQKEVNDSYCNNKFLLQVCRSKYPSLVNLLLSRKEIDASYKDNKCLIAACMGTRNYHDDEPRAFKIVKLLLADESVNPAAQKNKPLNTACESGFLQIAELLLLDKRVNPTGNGDAIIRACERNYVNVVQAILAKKGVDVSASNYKVIKTALRSGNKTAEICLLLLNREEVDLSANDNEFFRLACKYKCQKVIEFLLENPKTDKKKLKIITKAIMLCK